MAATPTMIAKRPRSAGPSQRASAIVQKKPMNGLTDWPATLIATERPRAEPGG